MGRSLVRLSAAAAAVAGLTAACGQQSPPQQATGPPAAVAPSSSTSNAACASVAPSAVPMARYPAVTLRAGDCGARQVFTVTVTVATRS